MEEGGVGDGERDEAGGWLTVLAENQTAKAAAVEAAAAEAAAAEAAAAALMQPLPRPPPHRPM